MRTTVLLGAGASISAGIPGARAMLKEALEDVQSRGNPGLAEALTMLTRITEHCEPLWDAEGKMFEIEALLDTVQALATRNNWPGHHYVESWASSLLDLENEVRAVRGTSVRLVPQDYLTAPFDDNEWRWGSNDAAFEETPLAVLRYVLLARIVSLTTLPTSKGEQGAYLSPIVSKWREDPATTVVSLNYDNVLELTADSSGIDVDHGISGYSIQDGSRRVEFDESRLNLLKLHGSASWARFRVAGAELSGEDFYYQPWDGVPTDSPPFSWAEPAIIAGGENKLRADGPFLELFMEFRKRLRDTNRLVVVGYSFRDSHVNEAIRVWMRRPAGDGVQSPHLVVINPSGHYLDSLYATMDETFRVWLRDGADADGVLDLALEGSSSDLLEAASDLY